MSRRVSLHLHATVAVALVFNIVCSLQPGSLCYAASGSAAAASGAAAPAHPIPVPAPAPPPPQTLLTRHVREAVLSGEAKSVGRLPANQVLRFDIVLPLRHEAELLNYIGQLNDRSSVNFHKFLTPEEITERFGPSQADWDELVAFAQASGFAIVSGSRETKDLRLMGTVGAIEKAFHVTLGVYQHPTEGRTFYSPDREPTVDLPFQLWHISGLDNYSIPQPMLKRRSETPGVHSNATTGSCPGASFCGSDIRAAYYGSGSLTGAGQYVGLLQYHGTELSDLQAYYTNAGQTNNVPITLISTDGTSTSCTDPGCDDTEQTVDMTQALGMAPGLAGLAEYIGSTDTAIISAMTVTTDGFPPPRSIGCSWGWTPADPNTLNPYWETMAAQGQNFFAATGDAGAWPSSDPAWPAEADYVVAVGGTDLSTSSAGGPWASETAWLGSGGGVSPDNIAIPSWQTSYINFATCTSCSTTYRNGPDVSANANNTYYVCADQTTCTENVYGGTSFAAPAWAGYLALANQQAASYNESIGFINPVIYQAAAGVNYGSIFHDITSGSNGYSALPGYDLATGWGSMNGVGLINLLAPASVATSTTLTSSPNPSTVGQSVTFTATVSPSPGTNGLMSFTSNGSAISGCSAAALSGGVATCTTSFSAAGANSIVATYVGALGYAGSTSNTVGQSVLLPSATSLTSSPNASSYGQSVTITATVNTGTPATGTMVFQGPTQGDAYYYQRNFNTEETGVDIGNVVYWFECAAGTQSGVYCYATSDYSTQNAAGYTTILIGDTEAHTLANIVAAINNNQSQCGYTDPTPTDNGYNTCFHNGTVVDNQPSAAGALPPQSLVTATVGPGLTVNLVSTTSPGNGSGTCWENYGWEGNSYRAFGNPNIGINLEDFASGFEGTCLSGGTPTATGTVSFTSNGTAIAGCSAVTMSAGVATCVTTMLPLGTDSLAAVYSGDSNYIGSTSNTVSQVVNQAGPGTITVTSSTGTSPSVYGQSVTFTASIPGQYGLVKTAKPGIHSEVVTGSVTWSSNTGCGTTAVTAGNPGTATCSTAALPVGSDTVT
ncbi:MAG: Ig-like domain repeat protein, partial [Terriglobales bacterium]